MQTTIYYSLSTMSFLAAASQRLRNGMGSGTMTCKKPPEKSGGF